MPQAVSLFPVAPPQQPRLAQSSAGSDSGGSSNFGDVLDSARSQDSSASSDSQTQSASADATDASTAQSSDSTSSSASSSTSTQGTNQTQKAKPAKAKTPIARVKKAAGDDDEDTNEVETSEAKEPADSASDTLVQKPSADTTPAKSKDADHPEQPALLPDGTTAAQAVQPPQPQAVKKDTPSESSDDAAGQPSKGLATVKAVQGQADSQDDADDESTDDAAAPSTDAKTATTGKGVSQLGSAKLSIKAPGGKAGDVDAASTKPATAAESAAAAAASTATDAAAALDGATGSISDAGTTATSAPRASTQTFADALANAQGQTSSAPKTDAPAVHTAPASNVPPETQFADANQAQIVSNIHAQLLPNGGSMQMHLNPGELGAMSINVQMRDGVMTATFETNNDQAAKLLSHSLGQLKTALETQGVSVGRLHVQQAPKDSQTNSGENGKNSDSGSDGKSSQQQQQEQQRREMLRKMWKKLNGGNDPLDMVA